MEFCVNFGFIPKKRLMDGGVLVGPFGMWDKGQPI